MIPVLRTLPRLVGKKYQLIRWETAGLFCKHGPIGVTYANDKLCDGAGAQLQRIYGIYSISRFLRVPYIHSPLLAITRLPIPAINKPGAEYPDLVPGYNRICDIPSDIDPPDTYTVYEMRDAGLPALERVRKEAAGNKGFVLVRILFPYGITDIYPDAYQAVKGISPFPFQGSPVVRIAIHVRRGDLLFLKEYSHRTLLDSYYIAVAEKLRKIMEGLKLDYVFELYSEGHMIDDEMDRFGNFDQIPNLKKFINSDETSSLQKMATANVLIISRSSYSYLAGLLNTGGVIMYNRFWHSPLKDWVITDDSGRFSKAHFIEKLKPSLSRRFP